jgi:hypothetical protein
MFSVAGLKERLAMLTLVVVPLEAVALRVRRREPTASKANRLRSMTQNPVVLKARNSFFCIGLALLDSVPDSECKIIKIIYAERLHDRFANPILPLSVVLDPSKGVLQCRIRTFGLRDIKQGRALGQGERSAATVPVSWNAIPPF